MTDGLEQAGQTANRIRGELLRTLEELERRRENLSDWKGQLRANREVLFAAGGVVGGYLALKVGYRIYEWRKWGSHRNHLRVKAVKRAWKRPQQVAAPSERSAGATLVLAVVGAFASAFAATLARRAAERVLQSGGRATVRLPALTRKRIVIGGPPAVAPPRYETTATGEPVRSIEPVLHVPV